MGIILSISGLLSILGLFLLFKSIKSYYVNYIKETDNNVN